MTLNTVFMGTPAFAVPTLRALHETFRVRGVVTQRDRPRGRGLRTTPTPVKAVAQELGLPVVEPDKLNSPEFLATLQSWNPDVIVVAAYGVILPEPVLELPPLGCVNLHASLLPRHRGASPISAAILAGDTVTGVCTILMDRGMDTGDILLMQEIPIEEDDTAGTLHDKLLEPGARLVVETLTLLKENRIQPKPQSKEGVTYTRPLTRADGRLEWQRPAVELVRQVRAMDPWPAAFCMAKGEMIKIWQASLEPGRALPGEITGLRSDGVLVGTGKELLLLRQAQAPSRKKVTAAELARSRGWHVGLRLE